MLEFLYRMATIRTRAAAKAPEAMEREGTEDTIEDAPQQEEIIEETVVEKPKKTTRKKATPKKKSTPKQAAPKPKEIRDFMAQQAEINSTILEQLRQLNQKDKCGQTNIAQGMGGQACSQTSKGRSGLKNHSGKRVCITDSSSGSDSDGTDSDNESLVRRDISQANSLLQARFNRTTGKHKSARRIERDIKANRPFAFLDREVQRQLAKENAHPEELTLIHHLEGLVAMVSARCVEQNVKAMLNHVHQILRDSQVHTWAKIRKWSNETLVKTATEEWQWIDSDNITQARNSHYMVQSLQDTEEIIPCPAFSRGTCTYDTSHFGIAGMMAHICAFCHALEGNREVHYSKSCGKRRASSNYFRHKDEGGQGNKKDRNKFKGFGKDGNEEKGSKN